MNSVNITGRLTADPQLKKTTSDLSVVSFTVAVDRRSKERQADFIPCVAWRQTAEFVDKYFKKGNKIEITGSLQSRAYEDKDGNKRTAYEVIAENVGFGGSKNDDQSNGINVTVNEEDLPF